MRSGHGVRALGPRKLRKCAERKVRAKIRTHFRKDCDETSFEFSFCRTSLSTEPFFSNMTATETATEKVRYMYSTFLQVLQTDCRLLLWRHETLFGAVQSGRYSQIINQTAQTRVNKSNHTSKRSSRDETAPIGLFRMKQTSLLKLSTMEIFPDMRI